MEKCFRKRYSASSIRTDSSRFFQFGDLLFEFRTDAIIFLGSENDIFLAQQFRCYILSDSTADTHGNLHHIVKNSTRPLPIPIGRQPCAVLYIRNAANLCCSTSSDYAVGLGVRVYPTDNRMLITHDSSPSDSD